LLNFSTAALPIPEEVPVINTVFILLDLKFEE
jgi:hypothetical protein